jgi:hypothetical protein
VQGQLHPLRCLQPSFPLLTSLKPILFQDLPFVLIDGSE